MRAAFAWLVFLFLWCLCGCGGESSHEVTTGENGTLEGLVIIPAPQTLGLSARDNFYLDWRAGYAPPDRFEVKLETIDEEGNRRGVLTDLLTQSTGHYILKAGGLPGKTFLLLTITGAGEQMRAIYLTANYGDKQMPPLEGGAVEHVVVEDGKGE